jgi:predicted AAA+ superfamily ATPase
VLTEYGHLTETFAVGEILKQLSWWDAPISVGHFRTGTGDEVDLVVETDDGHVIGFEIKAGTSIHGEDLRGIRALRAKLGNRLTATIILYTGPHAYRHQEGSLVLPLDCLWTTASVAVS